MFRLGLGALAIVVACGGGDGVVSSSTRRIPVRATPAIVEPLALVVDAVGTLRAERAVEVKPKRAGHVVALPLQEGEPVETGAVLARLDDAELRAEADVARASVRDATARREQAARELARLRTLDAAGLISKRELDDARVEHERSHAASALAAATLRLAEARLADTVVTAPFGGVLGQRRVDVGAYVSEGDVLVTLVDADPLEIEFAVPERYVGRLRIGHGVTIETTSHPDDPRRGEIVFVAPEVDPVNRSATVKARLGNPDRVLRPGQFASVAVTLERRDRAIVVPEEALVPDGDRTLVFVVGEDDMAIARPIELGLRVPGRVEIRNGLSEGERVVRTGHERLDRTAPTPVDLGEAG